MTESRWVFRLALMIELILTYVYGLLSKDYVLAIAVLILAYVYVFDHYDILRR